MASASDLVSDRAVEPALVAHVSGRAAVIDLKGSWTIAHGEALARVGRDFDIGAAREVTFDASALTGLDTAGARALKRLVRQAESAGATTRLEGMQGSTVAFYRTVAGIDMHCPPPPEVEAPLTGLVIRLGRATIDVAKEAFQLLNFLGATITVLGRLLLRPRRIRWVSLVAQMERTGLNALPIVGLISFLVGVVMAYQGADQLARFGAQIFTVNLVAIGVLREMGILLTAIIVAGRSGSAFTAEIGTMKVNQEIDALKTIGLDFMEVLVMPRVIGLIIVLPLLTFYADIMGLLGGALMASAELDISLAQFARQLSDSVAPMTFWVGIIKAPVFAFIIAMVGCYEGLQVSMSAASVGRQTTKAVVEAIFLVIVLDAIFSIFFSTLGV